MGVLTIVLVKCTNLAKSDLLSFSDPYVRLEVKQDNWAKDMDYGFQVSSVQKDNLNPIWNESFTFRIPTLKNMMLVPQVRDKDIGTRDGKLGWCKIKLDDDELDLLANGTSLRDLERVVDRKFTSEHGKIHIQLAYTEDDTTVNPTPSSTTTSNTTTTNTTTASQPVTPKEVITNEIEC